MICRIEVRYVFEVKISIITRSYYRSNVPSNAMAVVSHTLVVSEVCLSEAAYGEMTLLVLVVKAVVVAIKVFH